FPPGRQVAARPLCAQHHRRGAGVQLQSDSALFLLQPADPAAHLRPRADGEVLSPVPPPPPAVSAAAPSPTELLRCFRITVSPVTPPLSPAAAAASILPLPRL